MSPEFYERSQIFFEYYLELMIANRMISALQPGTETYERYLQAAHDLSVMLLRDYYDEYQAVTKD